MGTKFKLVGAWWLTATLFLLTFCVINSSRAMDIYDLVGKSINEVESFFSATIVKHTCVNEPPGVLRSVKIEMSNGVAIRVYISEFKYVKQFSRKLKWDKKKLFKEKISRVEFVTKHDLPFWWRGTPPPPKSNSMKK